MAKKTPVSQNRLRAIDDPTAAFPIGALAGMVEKIRREEEEADLEETEDGLAEHEDDEQEWEEARPGGIHPAFLVLSLLGGAVAAMAVVGLVALLLFFL